MSRETVGQYLRGLAADLHAHQFRRRRSARSGGVCRTDFDQVEHDLPPDRPDDVPMWRSRAKSWMRALDDFYRGQQTGVTARPGYREARLRRMGVLLDGARFAVNKSLHVLITPVRMPPVQLRAVASLGSPPMAPVTPPAIYLWPDLSGPPADGKESPKAREAYAARYAHQSVGTTIDELAAWFVEAWKP